MYIVKQKNKTPSLLYALIIFLILIISMVLAIICWNDYELISLNGIKKLKSKTISKNKKLIKNKNFLITSEEDDDEDNEKKEEENYSYVHQKQSFFYTDRQLDLIYEDRFGNKKKSIINVQSKGLQEFCLKKENLKIEKKNKEIVPLKKVETKIKDQKEKKNILKDKNKVKSINKNEKKIIKKIINIKKEEPKGLKEESKIINISEVTPEVISEVNIKNLQPVQAMVFLKEAKTLINKENIEQALDEDDFSDDHNDEQEYIYGEPLEEGGSTDKKIMEQEGSLFYDKIYSLVHKFPGRYKKVTLICLYEIFNKMPVINFENETEIPYAYKVHIISILQRNIPDNILFGKKLKFIL